jgi:hypothetical protein
MRSSLRSLAVVLFLPAGLARAGDTAAEPHPVPLTRPQLKQYLEDLKDQVPWIPVPALTDEDRAALGDRADRYEAQLKHFYMPSGENRGSSSGTRQRDPIASLDSTFKTRLFWIVSRINNCHY